MRPVFALVVLVVLAAHSRAQDPCAQWIAGFGPPGLGGSPTMLRVLNVGGVDKLFASGTFTSAGNVPVAGTAYWDGQNWEAGTTVLGPTEGIRDLVVFDDGSGPATYAAGRFQTTGTGKHVGRWDGTSFFDVGGGVTETGLDTFWVQDLAVFDDGSGSALYACGNWREIGGQPIRPIARWTGTGWSSVGPTTTYPESAALLAMCVFDDGGGPALYAGGMFTGPVGAIARWDGTSWSQVGAGFSPTAGSPYVRALVVHDDGSGPALYAGGSFTAAGGAAANLARWDGTSWSAVGSNAPAGTHSGLYSWGSMLVVDGIHFWDGATWTTPNETPAWGGAHVMVEYDDGTGPALFVGGSFRFVGSQFVASVAKFTGTTYEALGGGLGAPKIVDALTVHDDGAGPQLAADFRHNTENTVDGEGVSLFDGTSWTPLGGTTSYGRIEALASYDGGAGPGLFAGGDFASIEGLPIARLARWNGAGWEQVGGPFVGRVRGMVRFDDGTGLKLAVCGRIDTIGGVPMSNVATWDGTAWASLGSSASFDKRVYDLVVFDDGAGPALHAGGAFTTVEGAAAGRVARWDGTAWQPLGIGMNDRVLELAVFDDGSGAALYAGGHFTSADGAPAAGASRWDGTGWSALGGGLPDTVKMLEVVDLGFGPVLFAGGRVGGGWKSTAFLEYWDGVDWAPYGSALTGGAVLALSAWDDPTTFGPDVFAGGEFQRSGGLPAANVAQLSIDCPCATPTYCTAKQNSQGCTPAISTGGSNSLAASDLTIDAAGVLNNRLGILIWSRASNAAPFQGGFLCVGAPFSRTPVQSSGGNPPPDDCSGAFSFAFDAAYASSKGLAAGDVVHAQYWSRDAKSPGGSSLSDAVRVLLCP